MALTASDLINNDIVTVATVDAYPSGAGNSKWTSTMFSQLDTIPANIDLGICINVIDNTGDLLGQGLWMEFAAPPQPIGNAGKVTGAFSVFYMPNTITADGSVVTEDSYDALTDFLDGLGDIGKWLLVAGVVVLLLIVALIIFEVVKK